MTENEPKILRPESPESVKEKNRKRFFSGLRNRFLALAAAGFITLGAGWGKDLLQKFDIEEKDASVELVLGDEITENALDNFKTNIKENEPEFARLAEEYKEALQLQLDGLTEQIHPKLISNSEHYEQDRQLISAEQQDYESGVFRPGSVHQDIETDHKLISRLISNPALLRDSHQFLNANLDDIFWGLAFLNDSDALRGVIRFIKPPTVTFKTHSPYGIPRRADTIPFWSSAYWQPEITLYPQTFLGPDKQINSNTYKNILIHELGHAFLAGSSDGKKMDRKIGNDFAEVLDEGRVQGLTYKIVRYLNRDNPDLKPIHNETDGYDQFLVIAEIMESIARTHSNSDFLVEWQLGVIDYQTALENLKTVFNDLGLSDDIYRAVAGFKFGADKTKASTEFLNDLLLELRLSDKVHLSDEFVRSIIDREQLRPANAGH